ncbi:S8 family serine peptidase [Streptacidiphilus monticola]
MSESGHGTHVSGIIAADRADQHHGVRGVAPGARIAAVRLLSANGQYYGENLVCGFLWAADHGARVINDSYFADPWKYNCPGDPDQAAIIAAVGRAVAYAQAKGPWWWPPPATTRRTSAVPVRTTAAPTTTWTAR